MNDQLVPMRLAELLRSARDKNASDVHIGAEFPAVLRVDGRLEPFGNPGTRRQSELIARELLNDKALARLEAAGDVTIAHRNAGLGSFRVHAYRTAPGISFAIRLLPLAIPTLESLHLPSAVSEFEGRRHGLIVFAGPTGSGKTTALAAVLGRINRTEAKHIITIEDPIEYEHASEKSLVSQREVGRDARGFAAALSSALRADPDIVFVGEMRDSNTMRAALGAAQTGHLVFTTLHTGDAAQTIDRIIDAFPANAQGQVRVQLSTTLAGVVCLRLVRRTNAPGRRAAAEVLLATEAVRNLIREQKTHQIRNAIATGRNAGMQTLESHLSELVMRREISLQEARAAANRPGEVRPSEHNAV
ncbi:MAG: type IV pilus twitching motility protein PilT [Vulcanimicrobiaceae bacterium]